MPDRNDDFYIGYKPRTTPAIARRVRTAVFPILALAAVIALALASGQSDFSAAAFDFGNVQEFEGRLTTEPYPLLHLADSCPHLLVDTGKRGPSQELGELDGLRVRASGQLVHRAEGRMIELAAPAVEAVDSEPLPAGEEISFGSRTLIGEIVDTKCYLGVMKPGSGKPHRSCAARCISGGVPPALLAHGDDGTSRLFMLVGGDGGPLGPELLGIVAQPVSVTGTVTRSDGLWYMQVDVSDIRLWPGDAG